MARSGWVPDHRRELVLSLLSAHRAIGLLGIFLPGSLLLWSLLTGRGLRGSISEYYYTPVRDILVGTLTAMALFFWAFRGFSNTQRDLVANLWAAKIAGVSALLLALAPVIPRQEGECTLVQCTLGPRVADSIHAVAAVCFFLSLATFCLILFPRSVISPTGRSRRLRVYRWCGVVIVTALLLIVVWKFLPLHIYFLLGRYKPIFWLEAVAVWAFAWAWLVRCRAVEGVISGSAEELPVQ